jgi:hypothetical protein
MNCVSQLYDTHRGADVYVVGTGASLRVFPLSFLENKITIGLNQAWKLLPVRYAITIRPELNIPEFTTGESRPEIVWATKFEKFNTIEQKQFAKANAKRFYYFESKVGPNRDIEGQPSQGGRVLEWIRKPTGNYLYLWSSISQTAVNLAANMGARNIILVGCDNAALMNNHHAHDQHTLWAGNEAMTRYREYYEGLCEIRTALRQRGVNLLSATPFLRLGDCAEEFADLCGLLNKPQTIENTDISRKLRLDKPRRPKLFQALRRWMTRGRGEMASQPSSERKSADHC